MTTRSRVELLQAVCALLPEPDALLVRLMPDDDPMTYVEAYAAARRARVPMSTELRKAFVACLVAQIEDDHAPREGELTV